MRESILIRIGSDTTARVWSGVGPLWIPQDDIETEDGGAIYNGGGELISVPDFQMLINGTADRLEVTISGVSAEAIALAVEEAPGVSGAPVDLGTIQFNDQWQQYAVAWETRFRADVLKVDSQPSDTGRLRSITLSVGTDDTGRSRAPIALFTDQDQRRRSPTDAFFNQVANIQTGSSRQFGPTS